MVSFSGTRQRVVNTLSSEETQEGVKEGGDKVIGDLEELGPWCDGPWKNPTTSTTGREKDKENNYLKSLSPQLLNLLLIPPVYQTHLKVRGQKNPSGSVHMDQPSKH